MHRSSRGRWPRRSRQRTPKHTESRPAARSPRSPAGRARAAGTAPAAGHARRTAGPRTRRPTPPCPSRSRSSRRPTNGVTMSKWSTRTSSLRPVSKKTSSPSVNSSRAPAEARPQPPGRLGHAAQLAELAARRSHQPVALAEREAADHDRRVLWMAMVALATRSGGSRTRAAPSRPCASCRRTCTVSSEEHLDAEEALELLAAPPRRSA